MSSYRNALAVSSDSSEARLALAAEALASGTGLVLYEGIVALRCTGKQLLCEVIDPQPSARRCENEYEVLVENSQRLLEASPLRKHLPDLPCKWLVVDGHGAGEAVLWPPT
ncbi:MAG TPA: hypothetical protein VLB07_10555 [Woeseiaceae bacterium]|nr:hypothetical protein [Woeseiaceae bacterium]